MSINNPSEEQHRDQLRMHAEDLRGEVNELIEKLDTELGAENYVIGVDGGITVKSSEWEISPEKRQLISKTETRLRNIYQEIKKLGEKIGFDEIRKTSDEVIH